MMRRCSMPSFPADFFRNLQTGFDKSLVYLMARIVASCFLGKPNAIIFILPLISLMKDRVMNLLVRTVKATYIGEDINKKTS